MRDPFLVLRGYGKRNLRLIDRVVYQPKKSSSNNRISVSYSRAGLAALLARIRSSSVIHYPSFGRGRTSRSYSNAVSPDRSTLRTVFRDTRKIPGISLIRFALDEVSRQVRALPSP